MAIMIATAATIIWRSVNIFFGLLLCSRAKIAIKFSPSQFIGCFWRWRHLTRLPAFSAQKQYVTMSRRAIAGRHLSDHFLYEDYLAVKARLRQDGNFLALPWLVDLFRPV